ncbi:MAG: hypothetical protein A2583_02195 [Bdellovibrionales bacterium RIFOXYD1_FULL_53_11]|nr:MAG: hypothetical protein A2583_02195 [Bdellovibrionales bacterium RIFOXYD1_FULL_53_11]
MKRSRKNKIRLLSAAIILLAATAATIFTFRGNNAATSAGAPVRGELIQKVTFNGTVVPNRKTIITAPYHGYIRKIFVKTGDKVKQGDPVVSISQSLDKSETVYPLRAPFAGTVVQIEKSEGEFIKERDPQDYVMRIDDLGKLYVNASVPELDRTRIAKSMQGVIKAAGIPGRTYKGEIRDLSMAAKEKDKWNRSQQVEFSITMEITEKDDELKPGMSVTVDIVTNKKSGILMLRHEYVYKDGEKYFVITGDGIKKPVETGLFNEEMIEIKSGITEKDQVVQVDFSSLIKD